MQMRPDAARLDRSPVDARQGRWGAGVANRPATLNAAARRSRAAEAAEAASDAGVQERQNAQPAAAVVEVVPGAQRVGPTVLALTEPKQRVPVQPVWGGT